MVTIVKIINYIFNTIFYPLKYISPGWGLVIASLLTGVVMLIIFRHMSNQKKIKWAKDKIKGHILEIRLYRDSPKVIVRAMGRILRYNANYIRYALVPLVFVFIPVVLILINLNFRYNYIGLSPEESVLVKVRLVEETDNSKVTLEPSEGIVIETPSLYISSQNEIDWRIKVLDKGNHILKVAVGDRVERKMLWVETDPVLIAPRRVNHSAYNVLMNPAEPPLPKDSPLKSIEVDYPKRVNRLLGIRMHWLVIFFVLSLVFAFALKGPMKVEI
jgi:hypothetical protein